jgi:hypothetical protein
LDRHCHFARLLVDVGLNRPTGEVALYFYFPSSRWGAGDSYWLVQQVKRKKKIVVFKDRRGDNCFFF